MRVLLTGGAGYIGSHTVVALAAAGHDPIVLDDFSNSHPEVLNRLKTITGQEIPFIKGDVADVSLVTSLLQQQQIQAVIHFAAFKAVGESVEQPLKYYRNNMGGLLGLLEAMTQAGCKQLVFSSSCTVYGEPEHVPVTEEMATSYTNPYGHTKLMGEQILQSLGSLDSSWKIAILRYFNPVGAHESGLIGEDPVGIPNNLMPYVARVAAGSLERVRVFGNDYPTIDGTGVRDYIHVMDLAEGHLASLKTLDSRGSHLVNLGTGQGSSVLEVIHAYSKASGREIPFDLVARRPGDIASAYADPSLAKEVLGWVAKRDLQEMCSSSWVWQTNNPDGYRSFVNSKKYLTE
jgi:UDP-glucose 4-epimerase